jgi:hypothetical protein
MPVLNELVQRAQRALKELLGTPRPIDTRVSKRWGGFGFTPTMDAGKSNYEFWDLARLCQIEGLEIGGAFLKPISSKITSYTLGREPFFELDNEYTQNWISDWFTLNYGTIQETYDEARQLGDMFIVVNPDLTLTSISPTMVDPIVDASDFSRIIGWKVEQVFPHPTEPSSRMTLINEFYSDRRKVTKNFWDTKETSVTYNNLIGVPPIIHIPVNRKPNEIYGRPDGLPLLPVLNEYTEVMLAGVTGNKRQGRPTPTFSKLGDSGAVAKFEQMYGNTKTQTLSDGTTRQYIDYDFDADQLVILGGTGEFDWKSPEPFASDTEKFEALLFYLIVQHSEIPEFVFGTAVSSSKASAEAQQDPFNRFIERQQNLSATWMRQLALIALRYKALSDRQIAIDPNMRIDWKPVTDKDGELTLKAIDTGLAAGVLDNATVQSLLPLNIRRPAEVLRKAQQEREDRELQAENAAARSEGGNVDSAQSN